MATKPKPHTFRVLSALKISDMKVIESKIDGVEYEGIIWTKRKWECNLAKPLTVTRKNK